MRLWNAKAMTSFLIRGWNNLAGAAFLSANQCVRTDGQARRSGPLR